MLHLVGVETAEGRQDLRFDERAIPFLVELRQYLLSDASSILEYIATTTRERYNVAFSEEQIMVLLKEPDRCVVMSDGLDEVFDLDDRSRTISQFEASAREFSNAYIIVTTRIAGYQPHELQVADFEHYTLLDFNIRQVTDFVHRWRIAENPLLLELAGNPLLLTMMSIIYKHRELPERRWELYERATSVPLDDWDVKRKRIRQEIVLPLPPEMRMGKEQKIKLLQLVSMYMLRNGQPGRELNAIAYPQLMLVVTEFLVSEYNQSHGTDRDLALRPTTAWPRARTTSAGSPSIWASRRTATSLRRSGASSDMHRARC